MKWYKRIFFSEEIADCADKIKENILNKKKNRNIFLITLPANDDNLLDIIPADMVNVISWREVFVIGVANSKKCAVELTATIISQVYKETGSFDLKEYFTEYDCVNNIDNT